MLLSRDNFRAAVFERDNNKCVICNNPAQDAHHIIERRLFDDGGYYINNGASLCGECHIKAEQTLISVNEIRERAGIVKKILPEHLYEDYSYTKWGDIENANGSRVKGELFQDESVQKILASGGVLDLYQRYIKYPRTFHLPFSPGKTEDDKTLKDCSIFNGQNVIITNKMDGENTTGYWDGYIHARSLDSQNHESRNWVKNYLAKVLYDLPLGWRICGENLYAKHAIHYKNLPSYFNLFSIWNEKNECLSWEDTCEWAALLNINLVPHITCSDWNEKATEEYGEFLIRENRIKDIEGFVVRNSNSFNYASFRKNVAKWVRPNHVETSEHWLKKKLIPNLLQ